MRPGGGEVPLRILVVGQRMLPFRHAGDKNFWLDVFRGIRQLGHEVQILSVMEEETATSDFLIHRVPPIPMYLHPDSRFNAEFKSLGATSNYVSKTVSLPRIGRAIRRLRKEFHPDVIHFADNYGPTMIALRTACGTTPMTISAPTYQRDRPFYDLFLEASFQNFDVIVPFSDAYRRRLLELGFPAERVRRIRWGIDVEKFRPPTPAEKLTARNQLGLAEEAFVVLWTGFTQQANEKDLQSALRTAELALKERPSRFVFLFCFKPEHFNESYRVHERPGLQVHGSGEAFRAARASANVLLAPIRETNSTAAPPLVWLECLALGVPVLTTDIPGADETVVDFESGFTVKTAEEASQRLLDMEANRDLYRRLQEGARRIAVERYSVGLAVREYVDLWSSLAAHQGKGVGRRRLD